MDLASLVAPGASPEAQMWQLTQSILVLTLVGFVTGGLYKAFSFAWVAVGKRLTCSVTLSSRDALFKTVRNFLTK